MAGEEPDFCRRCFELEKMGERSFRQTYMQEYQEILPELSLDITIPTGQIVYWDMRYTNKCNLACRSCSSMASSGWIPVNEKLNLSDTVNSVTNVFTDNPDLKPEFLSSIKNARSIYFAGGEPLIMKETLDVLRFLIAEDKTDIELIYNSNMTNLEVMGEDLIELWKHFPDIKLRISLDGMGERGDYIRQGSNCDIVLQNCLRVSREAPHITRILMPVFQLYNAFHLRDFLQEYAKQGIYNPDCLHINALQAPIHLSLQVLPTEWKERVRSYWQGFENLLGPQENLLDQFLFGRDHSRFLPEFYRYTDQLDHIFQKNFETIFPEFDGLRPKPE